MDPEKALKDVQLIVEGQDDGFKQVIAQLTKNLIDGTMNLPRYKLEVAQAWTRLQTGRFL